jgi:DNA-binding protein YbaB
MNRGMDAERYAAVSAAAAAELVGFGATAGRLARSAVETRSRDGRVRARAAGGGHVTGLHLSDDVLARYPVGALGDVIARTVRDAQRRAEEAFQQEMAEMTLPALAEVEQIMAELEAEGRE